MLINCLSLDLKVWVSGAVTRVLFQCDASPRPGDTRDNTYDDSGQGPGPGGDSSLITIDMPG